MDWQAYLAVFQFVGDEVVVIWNLEDGIINNNCVKFFFLAESLIKEKQEYYNSRYGICPKFKAGVHSGSVIVAEVGGSKTDIAYHGDTINTAARIRSMCGELERTLLISAELLGLLNDIDEDLLLAKMYSIHKENFLHEYTFNEKYIINKEENSITDMQNNKLIINGKPFSILEYLIKNRHRAAVSKEELLDVLWDDPEWVVRNVVEVNINIIRKGIQNTFQDNFINTIRHRGYQVLN